MKRMILTLIVLTLSGNAYCSIDANKAVMACMGEAEGEDQTGKIAMMEALRNRGTLKGVYGYKAIKLINGDYYRITPRKRKLSNATVKACQAAWFDSKHTNYVKGATSWEAIETFGKPKWYKDMIVTTKIGNHTFMKPRR